MVYTRLAHASARGVNRFARYGGTQWGGVRIFGLLDACLLMGLRLLVWRGNVVAVAAPLFSLAQ